MKTIDMTPTWEQWMNIVMAIALRGKDPAKVLEPLSEDFKKVARGADAWNAIPQETPDAIQEAIDQIKYHSEGQTDGKGNPMYPALVDKLAQVLEGLNKAIEIAK